MMRAFVGCDSSSSRSGVWNVGPVARASDKANGAINVERRARAAINER